MTKSLTLGQMFINMLEDVKEEIESLPVDFKFNPIQLDTVKDYNNFVEDWVYDIEARIELGYSCDEEYDRQFLDDLKHMFLDFKDCTNNQQMIEYIDNIVGFLE